MPASANGREVQRRVLEANGEVDTLIFDLNEGATGISQLNILGLSGALGGVSTNRALLEAAGERAPEGVTGSVYDDADVALFNANAGRAEVVERLKATVRAADAVLISTLDYNDGVPGGLRNAIGHASRPADKSVFRDKPTAVMSISGGPGGGARYPETPQDGAAGHGGYGVPVAPDKGGRLTVSRRLDISGECHPAKMARPGLLGQTSTRPT